MEEKLQPGLIRCPRCQHVKIYDEFLFLPDGISCQECLGPADFVSCSRCGKPTLITEITVLPKYEGPPSENDDDDNYEHVCPECKKPGETFKALALLAGTYGQKSDPAEVSQALKELGQIAEEEGIATRMAMEIMENHPDFSMEECLELARNEYPEAVPFFSTLVEYNQEEAKLQELIAPIKPLIEARDSAKRVKVIWEEFCNAWREKGQKPDVEEFLAKCTSPSDIERLRAMIDLTEQPC